jgi:hypothetical protein
LVAVVGRRHDFGWYDRVDRSRCFEVVLIHKRQSG